jgi:hypothetical protein
MALDYETAMQRRHREDIVAPDMRRRRASQITALVMNALHDHLAQNSLRDAHEALFKLFWESGFDAVTDEDRKNAGLPDRGDLGWTDRELHAMEAARLAMLLKPIIAPAQFFPLTPTPDDPPV